MKKKWKKYRTGRIEVRGTTAGCAAVQAQGALSELMPRRRPRAAGRGTFWPTHHHRATVTGVDLPPVPAFSQPTEGFPHGPLLLRPLHVLFSSMCLLTIIRQCPIELCHLREVQEKGNTPHSRYAFRSVGFPTQQRHHHISCWLFPLGSHPLLCMTKMRFAPLGSFCV